MAFSYKDIISEAQSYFKVYTLLVAFSFMHIHVIIKICFTKKKETMKNGKSGAESFTESMREKLGLNNPLPKKVMDNLREDVIDLGKKTGDTDADE